MDKKAMYNLSYGLFVLTSAFEGKDSGCIINTAGQVTSEPNRISIAVNKANYTGELVQNSGKFNISILSQEAAFDTFRHFGFQSGRTVDKFAGYTECRRSANGLYYVTAGTNGYISATVEQTHNDSVQNERYLRRERFIGSRGGLPQPIPIISLKSSRSRTGLLLRGRPYGAAVCAVMSMMGRSCRLILSARCVSTLHLILKR